jgi:WXG100 family type VII secretion target
LRLSNNAPRRFAARVDNQVADLHDSWSGDAASAHLALHDEWKTAATQMREALAELREAARVAHRNCSGVIEVNMAMWP